MEKTRVPRGEEYYYVGLLNADIVAFNMKDFRNKFDDDCFASGNYFATRKEAEGTILKLRAVLNGADVIEMPSKEEFYEFAPSTDKLGGFSLENRRQVQGFQDCWDWLKSKIVK